MNRKQFLASLLGLPALPAIAEKTVNKYCEHCKGKRLVYRVYLGSEIRDSKKYKAFEECFDDGSIVFSETEADPLWDIPGHASELNPEKDMSCKHPCMCDWFE